MKVRILCGVFLEFCEFKVSITTHASESTFGRIIKKFQDQKCGKYSRIGYLQEKFDLVHWIVTEIPEMSIKRCSQVGFSVSPNSYLTNGLSFE